MNEPLDEHELEVFLMEKEKEALKDVQVCPTCGQPCQKLPVKRRKPRKKRKKGAFQTFADNMAEGMKKVGR